MRELFDEVAGKSPVDPEEAVRRTTRGPQRKRFYKNAGVTEAPGGFVVTRGWVVMSQWPVIDLAKKLERLGLKYLISTNVAVDGMLKGPDFTGLKELLKAVKIPVIASGGISSLDDLKTFMAMKSPNLLGAITGKAIYEGKLDFSEAVKICSTSA